MYKKAAQLKLRFNTEKGPLTVEQLFTLSDVMLVKLIKALNEARKEFSADDELSFLTGEMSTSSKEKEFAELRFNLAKDVYTTRINERSLAKENATLTQEMKMYEELLHKKRIAEMESMSVEEIEAKLAELDKKRIK